MQGLYRRALVAVMTAFLLGMGATARAQVNGNATITASDPVFGQITVSTSSQFAGAVSSIKWANKEFINNWDHGRQLSPNYQFFNRFICYNPYETGSFDDGNKPTSSSHLLSLTASGNRLESTTQMAWYYSQFVQNAKPEDYCGDPASVNWWFVVPPNPFYPDPNNPSQPDPNFACVHVGSIHRYDSFNGSGWYPQDRAYLVIGNLEQVRQGLASVHSQFTALDPE